MSDGGGAAGQAATILIAEDSPTQATQLIFLLEEQGYTVLAARDGKRALAMAQQNKPDLIISDIMMPELDGYGLCSAVKADPLMRTIPVILVTELSSPHDVFRGLNAGADNFIVKPYDEKLLLSRVNYLLTNLELRKTGKLQLGIEIELSGQRHFITAERQQILDLLISTYEQAVRLYDVLDVRQKALSRSYETLNALYHLADGLNHCHTITDVGISAVDLTLKLPGVHACWIFLSDRNDFRLLAAKGAPPSLFPPGAPCGSCTCLDKLRAGTVETTVNVIECDLLVQAGDAGNLRYHASVPLQFDGGVIGLLNLVGTDRAMFSDEERQTLAGVGNQIATALARAQLLENLERKVAERTRELQAEVAERREAELAARRSAEKARGANRTISAILEASPVGIVTVDAYGIVQTWNRAAETIFGYTAAEIVGHTYPEALDSGPTLEAMLERLAAGEVLRNMERVRRRKDGAGVPLRGSLAPLFDDCGDFLGAVMAVEDVGERMRIEDQLRQAQKMEAIGNLTGGIAHDFNNMLTVVIGNLDLMTDMLQDQPLLHELAESALGASLRGAELTRQLLAFSRRQPLTPEIVDVNRLLRGMVKLLSRTLGEHIEIKLFEEIELWPVLVDPAQLDSVIVNLSVNARDAMPEGGKLTISTRNQILDEDFTRSRPEVHPGRYVVIEVSDTGTGMAPDVVSHIFEPFFTTKAVHKGTGLGLAMVYGFVKQSGGHIAVYSEPGHGTTFRLYLPQAQVAEAKDKVADHPEVLLRGRESESILVVEDSPAVRQMVMRQIAELGYRVICASDAAEALKLLEAGTPVDLLFSDIVMPGEMNGIALAKEATRRWPHLKVALTSGFSEEAMNRNGGFTDFTILSKPYRQMDLARKLRQVMEA